jgi:gas vesicle protein
MNVRKILGISLGVLLAAVFLLYQDTVWAATDKEILEKIEQLSQTIQRQQQEIQELQQQLRQKMDAAKAEEMKQELQASVKKEVKEESGRFELPEWTKRITFSGDLRLRWENRQDLKTYALDPATRQYKETGTYMRNQFRYRLRLFFDARLSDEFKAVLSFGSSTPLSGTTDNNTTVSNATFGNEWTQKPDYWLLAYIRYTPKWLPGLQVYGGKFKPPWIHTDMFFDPDTAVEGFWESYTYDKFKPFQPFGNLGQFVVNETSTKADAMMYLYQLGFVSDFDLAKLTLAGSYYDWRDMDGSRIGSTAFGGGFGNTVNSAGILRYDYKIYDAIGFFDFKIGRCPLRLFGEYAKNSASDVKYNTAWQAGFVFGRTQKPGDWDFLYKHAYIENDALVGAFADGDFYFANRQGDKFWFTYRLLKFLDFRTTYFMTDVVNKTADKPNGDPDRRLQVDLIFRW